MEQNINITTEEIALEDNQIIIFQTSDGNTNLKIKQDNNTV